MVVDWFGLSSAAGSARRAGGGFPADKSTGDPFHQCTAAGGAVRDKRKYTAGDKRRFRFTATAAGLAGFGGVLAGRRGCISR